MDTQRFDRLARHEAAALWIAALLMLAGIALWAWWAGRPDVQPSLRIAGMAQVQMPVAEREPPSTDTSVVPATPETDDVPAEMAPTF